MALSVSHQYPASDEFVSHPLAAIRRRVGSPKLFPVHDWPVHLGPEEVLDVTFPEPFRGCLHLAGHGWIEFRLVAHGSPQLSHFEERCCAGLRLVPDGCAIHATSVPIRHLRVFNPGPATARINSVSLQPTDSCPGTSGRFESSSALLNRVWQRAHSAVWPSSAATGVRLRCAALTWSYAHSDVEAVRRSLIACMDNSQLQPAWWELIALHEYHLLTGQRDLLHLGRAFCLAQLAVAAAAAASGVLSIQCLWGLRAFEQLLTELNEQVALSQVRQLLATHPMTPLRLSASRDLEFWCAALLGHGAPAMPPVVSAATHPHDLMLAGFEVAARLRANDCSSASAVLTQMLAAPSHATPRSDWALAGWALQRFYLGLRPNSPGWAQYEVAPNPTGLDWVRGAVATPYGPIEVEIELRDGVLRGKLSQPDGLRVRLPDDQRIRLEIYNRE